MQVPTRTASSAARQPPSSQSGSMPQAERAKLSTSAEHMAGRADSAMAPFISPILPVLLSLGADAAQSRTPPPESGALPGAQSAKYSPQPQLRSERRHCHRARMKPTPIKRLVPQGLLPASCNPRWLCAPQRGRSARPPPWSDARGAGLSGVARKTPGFWTAMLSTIIYKPRPVEPCT